MREIVDRKVVILDKIEGLRAAVANRLVPREAAEKGIASSDRADGGLGRHRDRRRDAAEAGLALQAVGAGVVVEARVAGELGAG